MTSTKYALPVKQMKELAQQQSEVLWKVRKTIDNAEVGSVSRQLEHCIREAFGRLEIQDLIDEYTQLGRRKDQVETLLRRKLDANRWYELGSLSDPKVMAESISKNGVPLDRFLSAELADEVRQVAFEKGYKGIDRVHSFDNTALSDRELDTGAILQKLKECEDVDEIRTLLQTQQSEAVALLNQRQPAPKTGGK